MYSFVARQPILNKDKKLVAYELLFRDSTENVFPTIDSDSATKKLVSDSFFNQGMDSISGNHLCFINFSEQALLQRLPSLLPKDKLVVEVLEQARPTAELLAAVRQLKSQGYKIALDDFEFSPAWQPFFEFTDIIKFDLRATNFPQIKLVMEAAKDFKLTYLAEKVETNEEFKKAKEMGFTLFQGYFFSKPELLKQRSLTPSQVTIIELLQQVNQPKLDYGKIENIFARDVSLSYKLLVFVNNMIYSRAKPITSFKQASVYLGDNQLRKFISVVATTQAASNKPSELYLMSIVRARFCEQLAEQSGAVSSESAFLSGLFSLLDSLLDQPMEKILTKIPLELPVSQALLEGEGELGSYLALIKDYENARWDNIDNNAETLGLTRQVLAKTYLEALHWSHSFTSQSELLH